ncbi:MAG TPA: aminoglycoside phosphotransferase family protein [Candidatus Dormibacteraeota bacterium]|nr:aminoglycoside phosphotransferase family protein [Candidatus Dormibacteraeota bacterium]
MHWEDVPPDVRAMLEERLGGRVVEATTQPTGFSPGLAARLLLDDGRRVFLKAVHEDANPDTPGIHRQEARILAHLPAVVPAPRLLWMYDEGGWVALCLEDIDGRHPDEPWTERDLSLVVAAVKKMAADLTPAPFDPGATAADGFRSTINGWQVALQRGESRLDAWSSGHLTELADLEAEAPGAAAGDTLLHFDERADNILIAGDRVHVVDWPWARLGAAWIDWVAMAPSVAMQGGPRPEDFLRRFDLGDVPNEAIDAVVCTIAGYFVIRALEPAPPGIPSVRAFQAAQGRVAISWLRERTGWD